MPYGPPLCIAQYPTSDQLSVPDFLPILIVVLTPSQRLDDIRQCAGYTLAWQRQATDPDGFVEMIQARRGAALTPVLSRPTYRSNGVL